MYSDVVMYNHTAKKNTPHANRFHPQTFRCQNGNLGNPLDIKRELKVNKHGKEEGTVSLWTIFNKKQNKKDISKIHHTIWCTMTGFFMPLCVYVASLSVWLHGQQAVCSFVFKVRHAHGDRQDNMLNIPELRLMVS